MFISERTHQKTSGRIATQIQKSTFFRKLISQQNFTPFLIVALALVIHTTEGSLKSPAVSIEELLTSDHGNQNYTLPDSNSEKTSNFTVEQLLQFYNDTDVEDEPFPKRKRSAGSLDTFCFGVSFQTANEITEHIREIVNHTPTPDERFQIFEDVSATNCEKAKVRLSKNIQNLGSFFLILKRNATVLAEEMKLELKASRELKTEINKLQGENDNLKDELKKALISLVIAQIANRNYRHAKQTYTQLKLDTQNPYIDLLIKRAYRELDNFENILDFIETIPRAYHQATAYKALMTEMAYNYDLTNYRVLTLNYYVLKTLNTSESRVSLLESVKLSLKEPVAKVISSTADKIRSEAYQSVIQYAKSKTTMNAFNFYIENIVEATYSGQEQHALALLDLVNSLTVRQAVSIIKTLLNLMTAADDLTLAPTLRMANEIEQIMDITMDTASLTTLKNSFPESIRTVIWETVCIRNADTETLLVEATKKLTPEKMSIGLSKGKNGKYKWRLRSNDGKTFQIMNIESDLFLYVNLVQSGAYFTTNYDKEVPGGDWELHDVDWKKGIFKIASKSKQQYLSAINKNKWEIEGCD